jgi:PAS domain S-box-containing protein
MMGIKSLFAKLSIWVTVCMVTLGGVLVGYASRTARREAFAKAQLQLQIAAREQAEALQRPLNTAMVVARTLAQVLVEKHTPALRLNRAQANDMFRRILQENHDFLAVYSLWEANAFDGMDARYAHQPDTDASGRFLPYWSRDRSGLLRAEPITSHQARGRADFYRLLKTTGRETVIEPFYNPVRGKSILITSVGVPIMDQQGFLGIAGIDLQIDFLQNLADAVNVYHRSGQLVLVTPNGKVAAMTDNPDAIGQAWHIPGPLEEAARQGYVAAERTAILGQRLYAFQPIQIGRSLQPWWVILSVPESVLLQEARQAIQTMTLVGVIILVLGIFLLLIVINKLFIEKVTRLNATTKAFGAGDYDAFCVATGPDEIGQLADSFNGMTGRIRAAMAELVEKDLLLTAVLDNAFQIYGLLDLEGRVLSTNKSALAMINQPLQALVGLPVWELPLWSHSQEERARIRQSVADARDGRFCRFEVTVTDQAKALRHVDYSITPLADESGAVHRLIVEGRDITEHRDSQRRQINLMEQLHRSQKMEAIGTLVGGVAHDFNNLVTGIMGACQILQQEDTDQAVRVRYSNMIVAAGGRAANLIAKLLAFARSGSEVFETVDVARIIGDTLVILEQTLNKNIRITFRNEAGSAAVVGDDSQIQNMLLNMAINASHAMPAGGNLEFRLEERTLGPDACAAQVPNLKPGTYVVISVRDDGCGMAPELTQRIFEPFFTTKAPGEGTGLGLATALGTAQSHRGAITVASELGAGTVFQIFLPAAHGAPVEPAPRPDLIAGTGLILLVDDEEMIRTTTQAILESLGYQVLIAENGREGVETFRCLSDQIQLVILDMIMPELGGKEAFAQIRAIRPDARIIVSSGYFQQDDLRDLERDGLDGFIQKPFRPEGLSRLIQKVLAERPAAADE